MTLPPECDFCDRQLDDDEELTPLWVGSPPDPGEARSKEVIDTPDMFEAMFEHSYHGARMGEAAALLMAVRASDRLDVSLYDVVDEVVGDPVLTTSGDPELPGDAPEVERHHDKFSAEIIVDLSAEMPDPDMMLCEICAEGFTDG